MSLLEGKYNRDNSLSDDTPVQYVQKYTNQDALIDELKAEIVQLKEEIIRLKAEASMASLRKSQYLGNRLADNARKKSGSGNSQSAYDPTATVIYTDGACSYNPGSGGWAWAVRGGSWRSGFEKSTTNNRMELMAIYDAIFANDGPLVIYTDSQYAIDCITKWSAGWVKRGWKTKDHKDVKNRDILQPLVKRYVARKHEIQFVKVKGHSGDALNDFVDEQAVRACKTKQGHQGTTLKS